MLFSAGVVLALEKQGVEITGDEKESYHSLFRYVGHLMGVDAELLEGEEARFENPGFGAAEGTPRGRPVALGAPRSV